MGARTSGGRCRTFLLLTHLHVALAFVGNLKKIKPKAVVAVVKGSAPKAAATLAEKSPTILVANAIDQNKEMAEQIQSAAPDDAKKILEEGEAHARESVKHANEAAESFGVAVTAASTATTTTTLTTTIRGIDDVSETKGFRSVDAIAAESLSKAEAGFAQFKHQLRDSKVPTPTQAKDIVRGHVDKDDRAIAQVVKSSGAEKGLQWIKSSVTRDGMQVKARTESFVAENAQDNSMRATIQDAQEILQSANKVANSKIAPKLAGITSSDTDTEETHSVKNEVPGIPIANHNLIHRWQWFACVAMGVLCTIAFAWQLAVRFRRRDRRSPTLLLESEALF